MIQLLTRYARHEFSQPNDQNVDPDLALLLNSARPLLQVFILIFLGKFQNFI